MLSYLIPSSVLVPIQSPNPRRRYTSTWSFSLSLAPSLCLRLFQLPLHSIPSTPLPSLTCSGLLVDCCTRSSRHSARVGWAKWGWEGTPVPQTLSSTQSSECIEETVMWESIKRRAVAYVDYIYCFAPISVTCHSGTGGNWISPHDFLFTTPCWLLPSSSGFTEMKNWLPDAVVWCLLGTEEVAADVLQVKFTLSTSSVNSCKFNFIQISPTSWLLFLDSWF